MTDLFDYDPKKHARTSDLSTSHEAAEQAETLTARHARIVLEALKIYGPLTSEEISDRCELTHAQAWRRTSDLSNAEYIKVSDEPKRLNRSGRGAVVWAVI